MSWFGRPREHHDLFPGVSPRARRALQEAADEIRRPKPGEFRIRTLYDYESHMTRLAIVDHLDTEVLAMSIRDNHLDMRKLAERLCYLGEALREMAAEAEHPKQPPYPPRGAVHPPHI